MVMLKIDDSKIEVLLKISRNRKSVSIIADGNVIRAKSEIGKWRYIYRLKLTGDENYHYFTSNEKFTSKKLPHGYPTKMIESASCVEIDYSADGCHANPIIKKPKYISLSDQKPVTGQRVKVLCELDDEQWEDFTVFMGKKMACEYEGRKKVLGWLPV
jgi:hypothetical protein